LAAINLAQTPVDASMLEVNPIDKKKVESKKRGEKTHPARITK
jgi:hypothetical protein